MRENSNRRDSGSDHRDPTLRDHAGKGGPGRARAGKDLTEGAAFDDADEEPDARTSPARRQRGETAATDRAPPIDRD